MIPACNETPTLTVEESLIRITCTGCGMNDTVPRVNT